jgi:hypothetical protein
MSLQASREFNNFARQAETTKMNIPDFELNNNSDLSSTIDSANSHVTTDGLHYDVLTAPVMTETSLTVEDLIEASQNIMCYGTVVAIDGYHYFVPHPAANQTEGPLPAQELAVSEINDATLLADAATADLCGAAVSCILPVADVSITQVKDCETTDLPFVQLPVSKINDTVPSSTDVVSADLPDMPESDSNDAALPVEVASAESPSMPDSEINDATLDLPGVAVTNLNDAEPPAKGTFCMATRSFYGERQSIVTVSLVN